MPPISTLPPVHRTHVLGSSLGPYPRLCGHTGLLVAHSQPAAPLSGMPYSSTSSQSGLSMPHQGPTRAAKDPDTARLVLIGGRLSWSWLCSSPVPVEHKFQEQSPLSSLQSGPPGIQDRTDHRRGAQPTAAPQKVPGTSRSSRQASPRASGRHPPASRSPCFLPRTQGAPKGTQMSPPAFDSLPSDNQRPRPGWGHLRREGPPRRNREVDGTPRLPARGHRTNRDLSQCEPLPSRGPGRHGALT